MDMIREPRSDRVREPPPLLPGGPTANRGGGRRLLFVLGLAATLAASAGPAAAASSEEQHIPLSAVFPSWEQGALVGVGLLDVGLVGAGYLWGDQISPSISRPAPGDLDRRISETFGKHHDALLYGAPDRGGLVWALLPLALYGSSTIANSLQGHGLYGSNDTNPQLRLFASAEALAATLLVNQTVKLAVGRTRPRNALYGQSSSGDSEAQLSFFSMHTALAFTSASFLTLDLGRDMSTPGRLALGTMLYGGAALIGFSRIYDQAHYFSDVMVGAAVGILSGTTFYLLHFHLDGTPRRTGSGSQAAKSEGGLMVAPGPLIGWGTSF